MAEQHLTLKDAVNQALRDGLSFNSESAPRPFVVEPHSFRFKAGVDLDNLNQLADELLAQEMAISLNK